MKSGPRLPQLEKALAQKRRPNTAINQSINKKRKTKEAPPKKESTFPHSKWHLKKIDDAHMCYNMKAAWKKMIWEEQETFIALKQRLFQMENKVPLSTPLMCF